MLQFPCGDGIDVASLRESAARILDCDPLDIAIAVGDGRVTVAGPAVEHASDQQAADIAVVVRNLSSWS